MTLLGMLMPLSGYIKLKNMRSLLISSGLNDFLFFFLKKIIDYIAPLNYLGF